MTPAHLELLRRLAINDEHALSRVMDRQAISPPLLDDKTSALVKVATLVAMEAGVSSYQWAIDAAHAANAEDTEIIDVLLAVAPIVGVARVNAAALALAPALGYDLESQP
ncbi:MAG TPA: carboxymuconolactone decarboxylase family protein [Jiangellaceae bacterium]|nr:carboxymuconolactone decarboxylase family protein [Jiangellaceae bacterium]